MHSTRYLPFGGFYWTIKYPWMHEVVYTRLIIILGSEILLVLCIALYVDGMGMTW